MLSSRNSKAVAPINLQNTVVTCMKLALMEEGHMGPHKAPTFFRKL